ncbi:MAG: extracellular solute-binding protein [Lachnospiraceae bacterium]|nr:extracellular solute-binding protein [Lachnospiraceae bacterium]
MKKKSIKKIISFVLLTAMLAGEISGSESAYAKTELNDKDFETILDTYNIGDNVKSYNDYIEGFKSASRPGKEIKATADNVTRYIDGGVEKDPVFYTDYEGIKGSSVYTSEDSVVEFDVKVSESGLYNLSVEYYPVAGKNSDIQRSIFLDGALPFKEFSLVNFTRVWKITCDETILNENGVLEKHWKSDNQGNQEKPGMVEAPEWQTRYAYDSDGYISSALSVYLTEGEHTISIKSIREPMLIHSVILNNAEVTADYKTVKAAWDKSGAKDSSGTVITIEGEYASKTSSQMLYPQQDQGSCEVNPASSKTLLNNTIGGNSWRLVGQWIEWEFSVPSDGYYEIALRDKQNFSRGVEVSRRITIDGEVPFSELSAYAFGYAQDWRVDTISDDEGNPYKFFLKAGTHTIRMENVLGGFADIVGEVEEALQQLNSIYREIIKITGVSPDPYRDYQIESSLPLLTGELQEAKALIDSALVKLEAVAGTNSDKKTVLLTMSDQLEDLIADNDYVVRVLTSFKVNIRALGNWITSVISQPLAVDSLCIYSPDNKPDYKKAGFFKKLGHEITRLFYSFIIDYNQIGNVSEDKDSTVLTLWIGSGRDQANVIKQMIDESFTPNTGVSVNVQLVDMNTLLKATLVGQGPDVAIQVASTGVAAGAVLYTGNDTPVNYGIRDAVLDLSRFPDCDKVLERFPEAVATQFRYGDAIYAMPETITFPVMFYRKDILSEIGLEIPKTWDEVKVAMTVLSKNQMEFGMMPNEQLFASLLFQNDGSYYNKAGTASDLDSDTAVDVFKIFCNYYTDYKLDRETSVQERFRTGECPIIIDDYTTYNNLSVSAPDIAGLWSFTTIPGTVKEDGTEDHTVACTGLASMIMANTKYPDASWDFVKWWTSAEVQTTYGREMESLMGSSARVPTANYEAFTNMSWPVSDFDALVESMKCVRGIPQVPGGYYTWRNVNNAFYSVVTNTDTSSPREELMDKVIYINAEIAYKMEELGIEIKED